MRAHASLLGARILQEYPALHRFDDPVSPRIESLLRKPFPAQTIAIMGLAKRWREARTGMVVAECGTGKLLTMSPVFPSFLYLISHTPSATNEEYDGDVRHN